MFNRQRALLILQALTLLILTLQVSGQENGNGNFRLAIGANALTATGVTPGHDVIFFGVAQVVDGFDATSVRYFKVASDDTHSGAASVQIDGGVPLKSVWIAVDTQTAKFATSTPDGFAAPTWPITVQFSKDESTRVRRMSLPARIADVLYVHSNGTAVTLFGGDGNVFDADGHFDGLATVSLKNGRPVDDHHQRPDEFGLGGILFVVDPQRLQAAAIRLTGSMLNGAH
jgi:hypothetical protein